MATEPVNERPIFPALLQVSALGIGQWSTSMIRQLTTVFQQYGYRLNKALLDEDLTDNGGTILTTSDLEQNGGKVPEIDQAQTWTGVQTFTPAQIFSAAPAATGNPLRFDELAANGGTIPETDRANTFGPAQDFELIPTIDGDDFVWAAKAIGEPFALRDDWTGTPTPPTDNPNFRYIKLTAGEDGVGQYNEGVLISESVSGSAPLVVATAVIDHAASPIDGETVHLWNTEGRYPKAGTSPGTVANDQMQQITGKTAGGLNVNMLYDQSAAQEGAFGETADNEGLTNAIQARSTTGGLNLTFDSANSPNARTGDHTDVKHQQLTYYMRIA